MIVHRTSKQNRKSILKLGLIPQFIQHQTSCPLLKGYVSASINFDYFGGRFLPDRYDYWEIQNTKYMPCPCPYKCTGAVVIHGNIVPENLHLITKGDVL